MKNENISKILRIIFSKQNFFAVFGLIIIASISWPLYLNMQKRIAVKNEIQKLKDDILIYENKNSQLDKLIKYLESDQYIEEQAKKNLNLKKEGENVMVIKNENKKDLPESKINKQGQEIYSIGGLNNEKTIKNTNPSKWVSYFLK
jgi:cell division protein FtsB